VLAVEVEQVAVLEVGMELDLVDSGLDLCSPEHDLEVLLEEVGHSDGPGTAGLLDGLEVGPLLLQLLVRVGEEGRVDQVQVHIVEAEPGERGSEGGGRVLLLEAVDLGGDEKFLAGDAGCFDGCAELLLVPVCFSTVSSFLVSEVEIGVLAFCAIQVEESRPDRRLGHLDDRLVEARLSLSSVCGS